MTGSNMLAGADGVQSLTLSGTEALVTSFTDSRIEAVVGRNTARDDGQAVLILNTGAIVTKQNAFAYTIPGDVDTVTPTSGQFGTRVTLTGSNMLGGSNLPITITLAGVVVDAIVS